mmetsp:Transcript_42959/g.142240  ORF Transcript_42959/g.142240 Transcript_42959/m.142240 type:complete len:208 (+) Transcript_42959:624-1247(+)
MIASTSAPPTSCLRGAPTSAQRKCSDTLGRRSLRLSQGRIYVPLPKADVFARQARDVAKREEELRRVRVFAAVAHGEHPSLAQLHLEPCGVVLEALLLAGEDALATTPIVLDKVAALRHKALDAAVEVAALVGHLAPRLLALASAAEQQRHKVLDRQRRNLWPHLDVDALRRHLDGAAASAAPLEIVGVQLLLDALELGTAKLRQPV